MGRVSIQEIKVFALFSAALILIGMAYGYSATGATGLALASGTASLAFIWSIMTEAQRR